jgi:tubulin polyglutamylase TTLL1/tubulin monoglycylase TTLL3/8
MIDDNFKVWLIETNINPDLDTSSPTLAKIIPQLIENVLKLTVDPIFPPPLWPKVKKN